MLAFLFLLKDHHHHHNNYCWLVSPIITESLRSFLSRVLCHRFSSVQRWIVASSPSLIPPFCHFFFIVKALFTHSFDFHLHQFALPHLRSLVKLYKKRNIECRKLHIPIQFNSCFYFVATIFAYFYFPVKRWASHALLHFKCWINRL